MYPIKGWDNDQKCVQNHSIYENFLNTVTFGITKETTTRKSADLNYNNYIEELKKLSTRQFRNGKTKK